MNTQASDKRVDDLLRKIRALRAKAEKTDNEHEAAAFAAKVAEMLAEHGLEEAQLEVREQSPVESEKTDQWKASASRVALASALCRLYMVRIIRNSDRRSWTLVGRRSNITMVREMSDYLVSTTIRLSRKWMRENCGTNSQMIDFRKGCFARLVERIIEMHNAATRREEPKYLPNGNPGNLPALWVTEARMVDARVRELFPLLVKGTGRRINMGEVAVGAGRAAGSTISLSPQIGGHTRTTHLLGRK